MSAIELLKNLLPAAIRRNIRAYLGEIIREEAAPRMIYGYRDSSGVLHPSTRVSNTAFINNPGQVTIGDNVFVGHFSILDGTRKLEIGEGTQIGHLTAIFTHSSHNAIRLYGRHYLEVPEMNKKVYDTAEVKIGKYVFIGTNSLILPGVEIGDGAIIAATAVIARNVAPFSLVTREGKVYADGARKFDVMNLHKADDPRLEQWYQEWQTGS